MRLLLIEDNDRLSGLLSRLLADSGYAVDTAATAEAAQAALDLVAYDLILLDLALPDGDGTDILAALRRRGGEALVLVATARADLVDRVATLNAGADDYLVKPFSPEELLARVRALLRRRSALTANVLSLGNLTYDTLALELTVAGQRIEITRREQGVLAALLHAQGRVLRREALERAIYSFDESDITPNAIEVAVSRLRRRLVAAGASVSLTAMRGVGYLLAEQAEAT
ncbi:MAG: response regulator transcription factor [Rhodospirillales bacterium]|nr:response regulator transcription factor [Rhodospirillales bacterium]